MKKTGCLSDHRRDIITARCRLENLATEIGIETASRIQVGVYSRGYEWMAETNARHAATCALIALAFKAGEEGSDDTQA
jgi:hypothetical protein